MAVVALKYITEDEYLAQELDSDTRHEYLNGQVFDMAGASPEHALITANAVAGLNRLSGDGPCRVFSSDLRIRVEATGLDTYPDASVVCGELRLTDRRPKAAMNPALLVEVLSESTQEYDRGEKWRHYQMIQSLNEYLLVWQDRPRIEHYLRLPGGAWEYRLTEGLEEKLRIGLLSSDLHLTEVYRGVSFPEQLALRNGAAQDEG